jgi:ethanolamine permease
MYIVSMLALFRLRRTEPALERPFRAPLYPVLPLVALGLALLSLCVIVYFNPALAVVFLAGFALAVLYYRATGKRRHLLRELADRDPARQLP